MIRTQSRQENDMQTLFTFRERKHLIRAISTKIAEMEFNQNKRQNQDLNYQYGNNEDWAILGQSLLEFLFLDYMIQHDYPSKTSAFKKMSDLLQVGQKLIKEENLAEYAIMMSIDKHVKVGNQPALKNNPKVLCACLKALIAGHYIDRDHSLKHVKEVVSPLFGYLLEKFQGINTNPLKVSFKSKFYQLLDTEEYQKNIIPKMSCSWKYEGEEVKRVQYQLTLEVANLYHETMKGYSKKETEENLYHDCLKKTKDLKEKYIVVNDEQTQMQIQKREQINQSQIVASKDFYTPTIYQRQQAEESKSDILENIQNRSQFQNQEKQISSLISQKHSDVKDFSQFLSNLIEKG